MKRGTAPGRDVVLFREIDTTKDDYSQEKVGVMSHWQAKRYANDAWQNDPSMVFFTLTKQEYEIGVKERRKVKR